MAATSSRTNVAFYQSARHHVPGDVGDQLLWIVSGEAEKDFRLSVLNDRLNVSLFSHNDRLTCHYLVIMTG